MGIAVDDASWVVNEFAAADLGDERRTERLLGVASALAQRPSASFPEAFGSRASLKGAYRFIDTDAIDPDDILSSHLGATVERMSLVPVVLAVQDTTEFDFTGRSITDMGPLSNAKCLGFFAHTTLAITPERVPLGILAQLVWARDPAEIGKRHTRRDRPIEAKESSKWLLGLQATIDVQACCPQTRFVSIGDREADIYDLFLMDRPDKVDLLIRAAWNRSVEHEEKYLWNKVVTQERAATLYIQVPRRGKQPARKATLTIRYCPVTLRPPRYRKSEHLPPVDVWVICATEENPPEGIEPIEWLLLTTTAVDTVEDALEQVHWYSCRWGIEILHKVLKSGCKIESRQHETAERIKRCLAIYSVIAWRILYATMLSRALPELPCTVLLDLDEWQALYCAIHDTPNPPSRPPRLRQAVGWIACLGGFLDRKSDGEPGVTVLWKGFQHLTDLTRMYRILRPHPS